MSDQLPKFSNGKRPAFFEDKSVDHLLAMILELSTELAVVYSQQHRLERFLESKGLLNRDQLNAFELDTESESEIDQWRSLFLDRLYHSVHHEAQSVVRDNK